MFFGSGYLDALTLFLWLPTRHFPATIPGSHLLQLVSMNPIKYFRQVREELAKVTWPTRQSTINMTLMVVGVSMAVGIYVGGLDSLFTSLFDYAIKQ